MVNLFSRLSILKRLLKILWLMKTWVLSLQVLAYMLRLQVVLAKYYYLLLKNALPKKQVIPRDASYAGLKDRHGVCTQWFSVPVPIKKHIEFSELNNEQFFVISQQRHNCKLRTGCHKGISFTITLRKCTALGYFVSYQCSASRRPHHFVEQCFGHGGHNLEMAKLMLVGERIRDKKLRGLVISAARSYVFNEIVSMRVAEHGLAKTMHREVFMLAVVMHFLKMR